nr:ROK family transcriptional regulator [Afifella sp. IM 167]
MAKPLAAQVLSKLLSRGPLSRSQLSKLTGLNPATVTRLTQKLLDSAFIQEGQELIERGQPGRRAIELDLRTDAHFVVGIAINAYEQSVAIADLKGQLVARRPVSRLSRPDPDETLRALGAAALELIAERGIAKESVLGCGVACAGVVDTSALRVLSSPDIGWFDTPVAGPLQEKLGAPVFLETMQNALNLTECSFGQAAGAQNAFLVSIQLGIGASLILDGRLIRGGRSAAATFGHMPVAGVEELCNCGRRGCLTTIASGYAVLRSLGLVDRYRAPQPHDPAYATLLTSTLHAAEAGDRDLSAALGQAGQNLGRSLKAAIALAAPDVITLSGPLAHSSAYLGGVKRMLGPTSHDPFGWEGTLYVSDTDLSAAAARLALERFVYRQDDQAWQEREETEISALPIPSQNLVTTQAPSEGN